MRLVNHANLSSAALAAVQAALPTLTTLQNFVTWGARQSPSVLLSETVQQDEFTHDVLAKMTCAGHKTLYLVLGAT